MKAEYKNKNNRIIALIMSIAILISLSSCTIVIKEKQITNIEIYEKRSIITIDFETDEFQGYDGDNDKFITTHCDEESMQSYEEFMQGFCRRIFNERDKYVIDSHEEVAMVWRLIVTYEDGSYRRLAVIKDAEKIYPDDWNEFVERTNAMIDYDLFEKI